ncbi:MAG: FtsX-like permease family protein, partial [Acidimicrobiales bacterium]|nr:FtsX-like permease family protein [Acidimicrobiales bacterium]
MTPVLVSIAAVMIAVAAHDLVRRPVLRRQAIRNLVRRPGETGLMIGGALLGTAIITASLVVGDTVASTVRDVARTNLGPIDEALTTDDLQVADAAWNALSASPPAEVDGLVRATGARVAVSRDGDGADAKRLADTSVWAFELDFDEARAFAADAPSGFEQAGTTPGPGEVAVSEPLAATLGAKVGDTVAVHAYGRSTELQVVAITPRVGLGGRATDNVHLAPGTLDDLFDAVHASNPEATPPGRYIYISNQGGVFDSAASTDAVIEWASGALASAGIDSDQYDLGRWKANLLEEADAEGTEFTTIFSSIGAFAVISGILLLVNIVAMLAEERRNQLGILRALGLRRGQVVRLMALEGTAYAVASTAIGVAVGVGVGWVVAGLTAQVFERDRLNLVFTVERSSLVTAAATGLVLTLAAVWLASTRLARLNVIAAIRDLDQPRSARRRRAALAGAMGLLLAGLLALLVGAGSNSPVPALVSVPLACAGLGVALSGLIGQRAAATLAGLASIAWGVGVFSALPDAMDNPEISVFVFQGVVMVSGAVAVATANQSLWEAALRRFGSGRRGVALRLGLAYPLARPIRSALLLAMFSLVIFTITFMAVLVAVFDSGADSIADQTAAGFDVVVETSRNSPTPIEEL